jgi:hypothetical protein
MYLQFTKEEAEMKNNFTRMILRTGRYGANRIPLPVMLVLAVTFFLAGCGFGKVTGLTVSPIGGVVQRGQTLVATVSGTGLCSLLRVHWGDGSSDSAADFNFDDPNRPTFSHAYTGWGGDKIVTAEGVTNCGGTATYYAEVDPVSFIVAFKLTDTGAPCWVVPDKPPLHRNTRVQFTQDPNSAINFGCPVFCTFDTDGRPGSSADSSFSFPGLREFSLVFRVGTQVVQGGSFGVFTTNQDGPLEVCANDRPGSFWDDVGEWGIDFMVNEPALP